jgi:amidohydrolase
MTRRPFFASGFAWPCLLLSVSWGHVFWGQVTVAGDPSAWIERSVPELTELYVWFHQNPEVSFEEQETAAKVADVLRVAGFEVTTKVGGHGVVGLLTNGTGKTLMLRTDLDALPVSEKTDLPYAATKTVVAAGGSTSGVMHACGHDLHMTTVLGAARYLAAHRDQWQGTLMVIGQPAEERGAGAKAMLEDGLFQRFPLPDYAVALHMDATVAAGKVSVAGGYILANVDSVDITVKGQGGHGSAPHKTVDPIAQAATLILDLQSIASREIDPRKPVVVTVGAIHGGSKHNIISDSCQLQLTVRSYDPETRAHALAAIKRKAQAIAASYRAAEPEIQIGEGTPALENHQALAERLNRVFVKTLGQDLVEVTEPSMGGEDFSQYGLRGVPIVMYRLGAMNQERLDRYEKLGVTPPSLHSSSFYPDLERALPVGLKSMIAAALDLLAAGP